MPSQRQYPWQREPHDPRDKRYHSFRRSDSFEPRYSLRNYNPPIWDQGNTSSCVAHAVNRAFMARLIFAGSLSKSLSGTNRHTLSRLATYYNARWLGGNVRYDNGAFIRDGAKTLAKWGAPSERVWPFIPEKFSKQPPWYGYAWPLAKANMYRKLEVSVGAIKQALSEGHFVCAGFDVYESIGQADLTGIVPMPDTKNETRLGGHAIVYDSWDDDTRSFGFANSWSEEWGDKGYGMMPYDYIHPDLQDDFWIIG